MTVGHFGKGSLFFLLCVEICVPSSTATDRDEPHPPYFAHGAHASRVTQAVHALGRAAEEVRLLGVAQRQLGRELLEHVELVIGLGLGLGFG